MNNIHRFFYLVYVIFWLLNEYKYLARIDFSAFDRQGNYELINQLILGNFLFGAIGTIISILILSAKKTGTYLIFTCAIGLTIAAVTIYLDASFTGNAGQAHMSSVLALFAWTIPLVLAGWKGILKDLGAAITKKRDDR
jgi:hypothetical protein